LPSAPDVLHGPCPNRCCDHFVLRGFGGGDSTIGQHPEAIASFVPTIYDQQQLLPSPNILTDTLIAASIDPTFGTFYDLSNNPLTNSTLLGELPPFWGDELDFGEDPSFDPIYLSELPSVSPQSIASQGLLYPDALDSSTIQALSIWTDPLANITIQPVSPSQLQSAPQDLFGSQTTASSMDSTPHFSSAGSSSDSFAAFEPSPPNYPAPTCQPKQQRDGCPQCGRIVKDLR